MIKKLLLSCLMMIAGVAAAEPITVNVLWPSDIGGTQANRVRLLVQQGNNLQDKYKFVFVHKPGAGGAIAANFVETSETPSVLVFTSSFFVRPIFYPKESYDPNRFKPVMIQCTGFPYVMLSKKYKSFDEIAKQKTISIGTLQGSAAEALVKELQKKLPNTNVVFVPYNNMTKPRIDVLGDHLDVNVDPAADTKDWVATKQLNVIGISGTRTFGDYRSFASQNISGFDQLTASVFAVTKRTLDPAMTREIGEIFKKVNLMPEMQKDLINDFCTPSNFDERQTTELYNKWSAFWPTLLKQ